MVVATVMLAACGRPSPGRQVETEAQRLVSSAATMRMTARAWLSGAVPAAFANDELERVEQSLQTEARKITSHSLPPDTRVALLNSVQAMYELAAAMRAEVQRHDPSALDPRLRELARTEQALLALARERGTS